MHSVTGTSFVPSTARKGNRNLESRLVLMLSPRLHIRFHCGTVNGKDVVVLEIPATHGQPTAFHGKEWIRVGSANKALRDVPEMEHELWQRFDSTTFEQQVALQDRSAEQVVEELLDHSSYWTLLGLPLPSGTAAILDAFKAENFIRRNDADHWDITNLGAIPFARNLPDFPTVARKAVRFVFYKGNDRMATDREQEVRKGYAVGFEGLMEFLNNRLSRNEVIGPALRKDVPMYPVLALRELIGNALIHQDLGISGAGPMVEVFGNRVETSNPGIPLGDIDRLLDQPPRSRNEALAAFMRRVGVCEERGSGVDKIVFESEFASFHRRNGNRAESHRGPLSSLTGNSGIWTRPDAFEPATCTPA